MCVYLLIEFIVWFKQRASVYTVGDFMTKKEELHVVKPTTTVEDGRDGYHILQ